MDFPVTIHWYSVIVHSVVHALVRDEERMRPFEHFRTRMLIREHRIPDWQGRRTKTAQAQIEQHMDGRTTARRGSTNTYPAPETVITRYVTIDREGFIP